VPKIKFTKEKKEIEVAAGTNLRQAMMDNGVPVYRGFENTMNCGGKGLCGACRVHVKDGEQNLAKPGLIESMRLAMGSFTIGHEDEVRLSCKTTVNGDCSIEGTPEFNWFGEDLKYITRQPD
jgi:ferredoxin